MQQLDAGDVVNGVVDWRSLQKRRRSAPCLLIRSVVNHFIGIEVGPEEQKAILERIGFRVENGTIYVPPFRNDIEHKADISEEIARFYGYGTSRTGCSQALRTQSLPPCSSLSA